MKKQFVRGGTIKKDREVRKRRTGILVEFVILLFTVSLIVSGCFGERVSEQKQLDSTALAPGTSISNRDPLQKKLLLRRPIVDRTGTVLAMSLSNGFNQVERVQPYGPLTKKLIGVVDQYGHGLSGVEFTYDTFLLPPLREKAEEKAPLVLAIDKNIQAMGQKTLDWQMDRLGANRGALIMMDLNTGQIVCMVSQDRSITSKLNNGIERNIAIQEYVHPWPVIVTWSLSKEIAKDFSSEESEVVDRGKVARKEGNGSTSRAKGSGYVEKGPWHWYRFGENNGLWTRFKDRVLQEHELDQSLLPQLIKLGFGQETGIDLPGERLGNLPVALSDNVTDLISTPINATALQVLSGFSNILKNGRGIHPHLALDGHRGQVNRSEQGYLLPAKVLSRLQDMIGDNSGPAIASYHGITINNKRRFQVIGLGFWPKDTPKVSYISVLYDAKYSPVQRRGTLGRMAHLAKTTALALKHQYDFARVSAHGLKGKSYKSGVVSKNSDRMPDVRGLSLRSALELLNQLGAVVRITGVGKVREQFPKPGKKLSEYQKCVLVCGANPS